MTVILANVWVLVRFLLLKVGYLHVMKSKGPKTEPWDTPCVAVAPLERS